MQMHFPSDPEQRAMVCLCIVPCSDNLRPRLGQVPPLCSLSVFCSADLGMSLGGGAGARVHTYIIVLILGFSSREHVL